MYSTQADTIPRRLHSSYTLFKVFVKFHHKVYLYILSSAAISTNQELNNKTKMCLLSPFSNPSLCYHINIIKLHYKQKTINSTVTSGSLVQLNDFRGCADLGMFFCLIGMPKPPRGGAPGAGGGAGGGGAPLAGGGGGGAGGASSAEIAVEPGKWCNKGHSSMTVYVSIFQTWTGRLNVIIRGHCLHWVT